MFNYKLLAYLQVGRNNYLRKLHEDVTPLPLLLLLNSIPNKALRTFPENFKFVYNVVQCAPFKISMSFIFMKIS
jgi:hypothetical protein